MKDLEKIKSEDLGCQVQDANPGNFAIEQEVAQLVGATVPAPTEPSADDARELGAQLLVFLRRALLPILSALRTAVAAIYAHLDSRCTDYTPAAYDPFRLPDGPYDPMRPFVPRTLPNLLTALTAFSARKISNGSAPNDGIPDGTSLAHLCCDNVATKLIDDNPAWGLNRSINFSYIFPSLSVLSLNCKKVNMSVVTADIIACSTTETIILPLLESVATSSGGTSNRTFFVNATGELYLDKLKTFSSNNYAQFVSGVKKVIAPELETLSVGYTPVLFASVNTEEFVAPMLRSLTGGVWNEQRNLGALSENSADKLWRVVVGYGTCFSHANYMTNRPNLIDVEIRQGASASFTLAGWNPTNVLADADKTATFLQNFREHIAIRLTANGSGLTLTLSQAVRNAIHAAEATYGIENIIITQKGWTISPAPN